MTNHLKELTTRARATVAALAVAVLVWSAPADAQITLVQSDCVNGTLFAGTPAYVYTFPGAVTTGNLLVMGFTSGEPRALTSAAGTATTWAVAGAATDWGGGRSWIVSAVAAGADTTVTITLSGNEGNALTLCFAEFTGTASDQSGAQHNGAAVGPGMGAVHNSGSVTPPTTHNVVVNYTMHTPGGWTYDSGFTRIDAAGSSNGFMGYIIQASITAQEANHSSDDNEFSGQRISAFAGATVGVSGHATVIGGGIF